MAWILLCLISACSSPPPEPPGKPDKETETQQDPVEETRVPVEETETPYRNVTIYYRHLQLEAIVPLVRQIIDTGNQTDAIKQVIDLLTIAPKPDQGTTLWPMNTYVREVFTIEDGTLVVDFDADFVKGLKIGIVEEKLMLQGLVNTLLENFPIYSKVRILVGGETRESFYGHVDIEHPLEARYDIYTIIPEPEEEILVEELKPGTGEKDKEPVQ